MQPRAALRSVFKLGGPKWQCLGASFRVAVKEVETAVDERMVGAAEDYAVGGEEAEVGEEEEEAAARLWCGGNAMTFA